MNPLTMEAIKSAENEITRIRGSIDLVSNLPELPAKNISATAHTVYIHVDGLTALQDTLKILKEAGWIMTERKAYSDTIAYNFSRNDYPKYIIWEPLQVLINSDKVLDNLCV